MLRNHASQITAVATSLLTCILSLSIACGPASDASGQCRAAETGEVLLQVRDAAGVLWEVEELPGEPAGCAVPWEVGVATDGSLRIVIHEDESGREIRQEPARIAEWVFHPDTGERISTAPDPSRVVRLEGYRWY